MTFGRDTETSSIRKAILERIELGGGDPVPIGDVVHDVTKDYGNPTTVCRSVAALHETGEIYEPKPAHLKRTTVRE